MIEPKKEKFSDLELAVPKKDFEKVVKHLSTTDAKLKNLRGEKDGKFTIAFANSDDRKKAEKIIKSKYGSQINSDPDWKGWKDKLSFKEFYSADDKTI